MIEKLLQSSPRASADAVECAAMAPTLPTGRPPEGGRVGRASQPSLNHQPSDATASCNLREPPASGGRQLSAHVLRTGMALVTQTQPVEAASSTGPRLTLVLATRRTDAQIAVCLGQLAQACRDVGVELVVASTSADGDGKLPQMNGPGLIMLPGQDLTLTELRLQAAQRIEADILVVLDDTSELERNNWVEVLASRLGTFLPTNEGLDGEAWRRRLTSLGAEPPLPRSA